jgi:catechol 2,3-dioxygenase-like lactoylglutathione lyase family enzyme
MNRISEIAFATLGVRDLQATGRFYRDVFDYDTLATGEASPALAALWQVPAGTAARYAILGRRGATRGRLRLLACDPPGEHAWGRYERYFDYGHYALNIRVPDIRAHWPRILGAGATPKSGPTHWVVEQGMEAWDSLSWDPDGTLLDAYTTTGRPDVFRDLQGRASELETVAIHVGDADRAKRFYCALGYSTFFDRRIDDLGAFFHLPDGVVLRDVNLYKPECSGIGRIEIVQYEGLPGLPVGPRARPPRRGILSISFECDDLDAAVASVRREGGEVGSAPLDLELPGVGPVRAVAATAPDGEQLEFYQRRGG